MKIFKSGRGNYLYAEVSLWARIKKWLRKSKNVIKYYYKIKIMFLKFKTPRGDEVYGKNTFKKWEICFGK